MSSTSSTPAPFRVAELSTSKPTPFDLRPDAKALTAIGQELDLIALKKLAFKGDLRPLGKSDWQLTGTLGATVVQPCVVTLDPVTTRIDVPVRRMYLKDMLDPVGAEEEMPEDDTQEELGSTIDPWTVMTEALTLHIPLYPRAGDVELDTIAVTEPGQTPMTDDDAKPFAGLAALKDSLTQKKS